MRDAVSSMAERFGRNWWLVGLLMWVFVATPARANTPEHPAAEPAIDPVELAKRPPLVVVRSVGPGVSTKERLAACRTVIKMFEPFPVRCVDRGSFSSELFTDVFNFERDQLDGRAALEKLFRDRVSDAHVEVVITASDLYETEKPYVFGLASLTDRVAIVSTARLGKDNNKRADRLEKLVLHEVGHTLGLAHHKDKHCVMRTDATVASLDHAPDKPCAHCHTLMIEQASVMSRPGQIALDHARGYLARGEQYRAELRVLDAIEKEPMDVTILNEIAQSFLDAGQADTAVRILETTVDRAPRFGHAHVNLGVALELRGRPGDMLRALKHFEHAVEVEPGWKAAVDAHAATLRQDLAHAQGPRDGAR